MKNVLVFVTSVVTPVDVRKLKPALDGLLQHGEKWNFDLEDRDHILRVESQSTTVAEISHCLIEAGFFCYELEDIVPGVNALQQMTG